MKVLSKSRFKVGIECPNKLFFYENISYANKEDENTFLRSLAEGGFQVEALARLQYPEGQFIDVDPGDYKLAFEKTKQALRQENVVLFEAAFLIDGMYVMTDIVVKMGNIIKLIEVKAKSFNPNEPYVFTGKRGNITSSWRPYLFDIAYQKFVVQNCYKDSEVQAFFLMADKSKVATINGLNQKIRLPISGDIRRDVQVSITPQEAIETSVISEVNVTDIAIGIIEGDYLYHDNLSFKEVISLLKSTYIQNKYPNWPTNYTSCKSCKFKTTPEDTKKGLLSGFKYCFKKQHQWSDTDINRPNIFELWNFRGQKLFEQNRLFLEDLNKDDFSIVDELDQISSRERRWIQVEKAIKRNNEPHIEFKPLKKEMDSWQYPLHFIDFETSAVAIPFNVNMHPYEQIAFQFSHHICHKDGSVEHKSEYINDLPGDFPNFKFVEALKKSLESDNGTIFRFATHENTILNAIKIQLEASDFIDKQELIDFIKTIATPTSHSHEKWKPCRPMVDLRTIILKYYYNPLTKGSNSIKEVLPAVLNSCNFLKNKYSKPISEINLTSLNFKGNHVWFQFDEFKKVVSPYKLLPEIFDGWNSTQLNENISGIENISDGGAALTAYSKLQFMEMSENERAGIRKSLLKYCELDTLAMVMIYEHLYSLFE